MPACSADQENVAVETEWYFQFYILWIILQVLNKDTKIQYYLLQLITRGSTANKQLTPFTFCLQVAQSQETLSYPFSRMIEH